MPTPQETLRMMEVVWPHTSFKWTLNIHPKIHTHICLLAHPCQAVFKLTHQSDVDNEESGQHIWDIFRGVIRKNHSESFTISTFTFIVFESVQFWTYSTVILRCRAWWEECNYSFFLYSQDVPFQWQKRDFWTSFSQDWEKWNWPKTVLESFPLSLSFYIQL